MRRAARIDENQPAIVAALLKAGCSVQSLAAVGRGVPDLLVGFAGKNYLLEIKNHSTRRGQKAETKQRQTEFSDSWRGQTSTILNFEDALVALGMWTRTDPRVEPQ